MYKNTTEFAIGELNLTISTKNRQPPNLIPRQIFCLYGFFGVPKIFQSDNGREFVNSVIGKLLHSWSADIQIIQGHPRHPQSQGAIERAHRTLEQKVATQLESTRQWFKLLPCIICKFCIVSYIYDT